MIFEIITDLCQNKYYQHKPTLKLTKEWDTAIANSRCWRARGVKADFLAGLPAGGCCLPDVPDKVNIHASSFFVRSLIFVSSLKRKGSHSVCGSTRLAKESAILLNHHKWKINCFLQLRSFKKSVFYLNNTGKDKIQEL